MAEQAAKCPIHGVPDCFTPALDAYVQQVYAGYCTKIAWPFVRIIPKGWKPGMSLADLQAKAAEEAPRPAEQASGAATALAAVRAARVEFYYSSQDEPAKQFSCDIAKALALCEHLSGRGMRVLVQDCAHQPVLFKVYNAAVTGPSASKRPVFGAKGALEDDMGKTVPALLLYAKDDDRYPHEVFPRTDKELGRLVGVEEALQTLIGNT